MIAPMADVVELIQRVPLFQGLGRKDLERVAGNMAERTFPQGRIITTEGEGGVGFFVIEEGTATVQVGGESVRTLGPGDHFGEIALIDNGPRSATVVAETELRCRGMTAWEFRPLVQTHPEIAWPLLETLAARLRESEAARAQRS
jgi:CRP/FNR family cyclic AMP-dependent transcriptional regulator